MNPEGKNKTLVPMLIVFVGLGMLAVIFLIGSSRARVKPKEAIFTKLNVAPLLYKSAIKSHCANSEGSYLLPDKARAV